ncbi:hypothetical protein [Flavobacterium sp. 11]|uniref:hypothetical protein n=1 Tax=Flavobacterium sp. 11 TaxID=357523 RepID=UPI000C1A5BE3|nr:hypothetical protein [Flavobacterium sp. 11]PIF61770.1 hypothetical protein CLV00_1358 [Flavobacterium sp. 11]
MIPFAKQVSEIHLIYLKKTQEIVNYNIYNEYTNLIIGSLSVSEIKKAIEKSKNASATYRGFKNSKDIITKKRAYETINHELIYKLHFQTFEEYLSNFLYLCFSKFPKFMNSVDSKNDIPYDKIFNDDSSIEDIKDFMVTFRVKKIIQSNNIIEIITKIEKLFNLNFELSNEQLDMLFLTSLNRNLLTHNNGIVNQVYLHQLKLRSLTSPLKKGDDIFDVISSIEFPDIYNMFEIAKIISKKLESDENRLVKHHESML